MINFREKARFIWDIADLLRGNYKQADYGKVILPLTVLRRFDCVLAPTKEVTLKKLASLKDTSVKNIDPILNRTAGQSFHNKSPYDFEKLKADPNNIAANLLNYINGFSAGTREILEYFNFGEHIQRLDADNLLYLIISRFSEIDLHPDKVSNLEMGYIFEELIRKFAEQSNETAGEHFTPREVIRLMVNLLFIEDSDALRKKGVVRTLYDPACGTGGMLSIAEEYVRDLNEDARLEVFGQEINPESYAICKADMLIKGQNAQNIKFGNSFTIDGHEREAFDYMLSNPPFGVDWKKVEKQIKEEHETRGDAGRFGAGYPRISDGSFLFLQHMISKMKLGGNSSNGSNNGSRIAIVFNGSPLFSGGAGSGESNIRRWIIENDWLEAIVAMPDQLFYNTGISTYVWIVTNRKSAARRGRVQLINATSYGVKMRKSLGNKRNEIGDGQMGTPDHIAEIARIYGEFAEGERSKIFDNSDFGYRRITVERPLRLNFHVTPERIARVRESAAFQGLARSKKKGEAALAEMEAGAHLQTELLAALESLAGEFRSNRESFRELLQEEFDKRKLKLSNAVFNSVMTELSERDETADICTDAAGEPEADAELRDYENVPLKEDIHEYFEREVKPHVADAWIDESKTRIGYEIPFTRYFYTFTPLRPLTKIETEIVKLEAEIQGMLQAVIG